MGKDSDEWLGSLDYDELLDVANKGTPEVGGSQVNRKTAARTEIDRRRAEAQLEEERKLTKKEKDEAIKEAEKKETNKEKTIRVLDTTNQTMSIKAFVNLTKMVPSTARRELGQAVLRGDIVRVNKDGSVAKPGARTGLYRLK
jgi:methylase of polypeptide subunit release factors